VASAKWRCGALLLLCALVGCNGQGSAASSAESVRLQFLTSMHSAVQARTGRLPANEQEFKQFIEDNGAQMLGEAGVSSVDELFVSERDGQPFVVVYGKYPPTMTSKIVVYEQNGVDGKRLVGHSTGAVELVDDARFREMVPNAAE
jgi:hypothetical protein